MDISISRIREHDSPHDGHTHCSEHTHRKAITSRTDYQADFPADLNLCTWSVPMYLSPPTSLLFSCCFINDVRSIRRSMSGIIFGLVYYVPFCLSPLFVYDCLSLSRPGIGLRRNHVFSCVYLSGCPQPMVYTTGTISLKYFMLIFYNILKELLWFYWFNWRFYINNSELLIPHNWPIVINNCFGINTRFLRPHFALMVSQKLTWNWNNIWIHF